MYLKKAPLVPTSRSTTLNTNKDCNPRNDQGPHYLPLGSIRLEGTPEKPRGFSPHLFPLPLIWPMSGEEVGKWRKAKSSPLHGPAGAHHFPISVWYQTLATRKCTHTPPLQPGTLGDLWRVPSPEARRGTAPAQRRLLPLDERSLQLAPSTLCPAPEHFPTIPNRKDQPLSKGRG